jgi:N-acetylmuramoyl-L-alanine amidase
MIRKAFPIMLCAALSGVCSLHGAFAAELRGLALSTGAGGAQLTLELRGAASTRVFKLDHPDRVVLDLTGTQLAKGVRAPLPAGVVSGVRIGRQPHGTLRVVMELKNPLAARTALLRGESGRRLVLTLGEPAVASAAGVAVPAAGGRPPTPGSASAPGLVPTPGVAPAPALAPTPTPALAPARPAVSPASSAVTTELPGTKVVRAVHAPGEAERDVVVAVDAGHGGDDPGAIGHGGTREKDVTLAIARALAERIDAEPGMRAVLTRNRDEFLELRDRIARAHAAHADMFVSVHADSIADRSIAGASVYVLSVHGASSEAARWLAERENSADLVAGTRAVDQGALEPVLIDAAQSEMIGISATAAERVVSALEGVGEVRKAQVQRAGFVVLKSRDIPSMLIETAYISNPAEERRLRSPAQQARLADAIATGVRRYFLQNPPDGTRIKQERRTLASAGASATAATVQ